MTPDEVLQAIPQQPPFRFIERIMELDSEHIVGGYTFKPDEFFYRGHFPGDPVTPGVILTEAMAQTGVVALGLYLTGQSVPADELAQWTTMFTECQNGTAGCSGTRVRIFSRIHNWPAAMCRCGAASMRVPPLFLGTAKRV